MPRPPTGSALLTACTGSSAAIARAAAIIDVFTQAGTLAQTAAALGISAQRFHVLRGQALQAMVDALEPKPAGRPPHEPNVDDRIAAATAELRRERDDALTTAELLRVRCEIAAAGLDRDEHGRGQKKRPRSAR